MFLRVIPYPSANCSAALIDHVRVYTRIPQYLACQLDAVFLCQNCIYIYIT